LIAARCPSVGACASAGVASMNAAMANQGKCLGARFNVTIIKKILSTIGENRRCDAGNPERLFKTHTIIFRFPLRGKPFDTD
jgi:hypothetical protein